MQVFCDRFRGRDMVRVRGEKIHFVQYNIQFVQYKIGIMPMESPRKLHIPTCLCLCLIIFFELHCISRAPEIESPKLLPQIFITFIYNVYCIKF